MNEQLAAIMLGMSELIRSLPKCDAAACGQIATYDKTKFVGYRCGSHKGEQQEQLPYAKAVKMLHTAHR